MLQTADSLNNLSQDTTRLRIGLGTLVAIEAQANTARRAMWGIEAAFAVIEQVDKLMHPARIGSDLAAIHRGKSGTPVALHVWTWEVLALSRRLNQISRGAFDPCLPDSPGRLADLEFAPPNSVILHKPLHIDLGGIAKGFAVDRALLALRAAGCHSGLVNAGGDLAVFGDRSRPVVIRSRDGDRVIDLKNAALATSDVSCGARPAEHRGYYHGDNRRAITAGSVTIGAASAAMADALTKWLLADDGATSAAWLAMLGAQLVAYEVRA